MTEIEKLKATLDSVNKTITQLLVNYVDTILKNLPKKGLEKITVMTVHDDAGALADFIGVLPAVYLKMVDSNSYFVFCLGEHSDMMLKIFQLYNNYSSADWKAVVSGLKSWDFSETKAVLREHVAKQLG